MIYYVSHPLFSLLLRPSAQKVYEARLPKLQVGPNVSKRKTGSEAARSAAEAFVKKRPDPEVNASEEASEDTRKHPRHGQNELDEWKVDMAGYLEEMVRLYSLFNQKDSLIPIAGTSPTIAAAEGSGSLNK